MAVKHLSITGYGTALQLKGERLQIVNSSEEQKEKKEYPLNRLSTINIAKRGVSISSNLLSECAFRGIRVFISGQPASSSICISGTHQHAVVSLRQSQFSFLESNQSYFLARNIIYGKIRNQRAVLLYFSKYLSKIQSKHVNLLLEVAEKLQSIAKSIPQEIPNETPFFWKSTLMGYEGKAASLYWQVLKATQLLHNSFSGRKGRGATDVSNQALNLGYAILSNYIWNATINAGMEVYAGCLHANRPGKPALILDLMEEYRPWVVDRLILTLRSSIEQSKNLDGYLKNKIISGVHRSFSNRYPYQKKKLKLETILQRQIYRLAGCFVDNKNYKPYLFKW